MITVVFSYFNNGGMLDRHLQEWQSYGRCLKEYFRAVIVDDCSEKDPALGHMRDVGFPVELYRIRTPIVWNTAGARNLGMHVASACNQNGHCWTLLTDIDHLLGAAQAACLEGRFIYPDSRNAFLLNRRWADGRMLNPHGNSYLICRCLYWKTGGCDEDWAGWWGAGEASFRRALLATGGRVGIADYEDIYLTHFGRDDIPDASTTEWGRRGSEYDYNRNPALVKKARGPAYKAERPLRFSWEKVEWK